MKVRIDVLKAPWPAGAKPGDVVEIDAITPAFSGKCEPVDDATEAAVAFAKPQAEEVDPLAVLKAEAVALGVKVDGRWSEARLAEEIAKAKEGAKAE